MNKTLNTTLIVLSILVLAGAIFFAGTIYSRSTMMSGWGNFNSYGPGMMRQGGMMSGQRAYRMGPGMARGGGYGWNNNANATGSPLTVEQARQAAEDYIHSLNLKGLATGEVMIFDNNGYVIVEETETGLGAFELLVDPVSQTAYPEHGPNMMWNLKYGGLNHEKMMGGYSGMMGGYGNMMQSWSSTGPLDVNAEMTVSPEQAIENAGKYLDANLPGASPSTHASQFYGYYTIDFEKDGRVAGMLSVNGYSGQVFLHTWHGTFIEEAE